MNKTDLLDHLTARGHDRGTADRAITDTIDWIVRTVAAGQKVTLTGFGAFEPVRREARTGRNPHTGAAVPIPATAAPKFRPGGAFKAYVADPSRLPDVTVGRRAKAATATA